MGASPSIVLLHPSSYIICATYGTAVEHQSLVCTALFVSHPAGVRYSATPLLLPAVYHTADKIDEKASSPFRATLRAYPKHEVYSIT
jgi:hypothetical protein